MEFKLGTVHVAEFREREPSSAGWRTQGEKGCSDTELFAIEKIQSTHLTSCPCTAGSLLIRTGFLMFRFLVVNNKRLDQKLALTLWVLFSPRRAARRMAGPGLANLVAPQCH